MFPLLLLGALLFSPDQPVAPVTAGAAGAEISRVHSAANAARLAVAYNEGSRSVVSFVEPDGTVVRVASVEGFTRDLAATRDGFLLAYGSEQGEVRVVRVRNDGSLGIARSHGFVDYAPAMAGLRARVLVFGNVPNELMVMDAEGRLIRRGIRVAAADLAESPAIAASSESFLLAWEEGDAILARLVDIEGSFLSDVIPIAGLGVRPQVASNGQDFLVTWSSAAGLDGRVVSATGSAASPPFAIARGIYVSGSWAAWDGREYVVAFTKTEVLLRVTVSEAGAVGEPERVRPIDRAQSSAEVASSAAAGTLIAWHEQVICGRGSAAWGTLNGEPLLLSIGAPLRHAPATAALPGNTFATVWLEQRDALRVRARVGDRIVELSSDRVADHAPAIASAGGHVAVLWTEDACFGRRRSSTGGARSSRS